MHSITREDWDAAWPCQNAWTALWSKVKEEVTPGVWNAKVMPFLNNCKSARRSTAANARVLMHKAWEGLLEDHYHGGELAFVLVHRVKNTVSLVHTRQEVKYVHRYMDVLALKTGCTVYAVPVDRHTAKWSCSSIVNKPASEQVKFSARRVSNTGDVI